MANRDDKKYFTVFLKFWLPSQKSYLNENQHTENTVLEDDGLE